MSNPKYWFPAKRYGWGWGLPITWQGWLVFAIYLVALVIGILIFKPSLHRASFFAFTIFMSLLLVVVCYMKGEPPKWRWGKR